MIKEVTEGLTLRDIAQNEGLSYIETTSGSNGYPSNVRGAIIGFDTFEQVKAIAEVYGLTPHHFFKKDGWQLWERRGSVHEPYKNSANDYGNRYGGYAGGSVREADFLEDEVINQIQDCGCVKFDELEDFILRKRNLYEKIEETSEDDLVITLDGDYYETIQKESVEFYHDTKHYAIGVISEE